MKKLTGGVIHIMSTSIIHVYVCIINHSEAVHMTIGADRVTDPCDPS